jgi:hypothetical protein
MVIQSASFGFLGLRGVHLSTMLGPPTQPSSTHPAFLLFWPLGPQARAIRGSLCVSPDTTALDKGPRATLADTAASPVTAVACNACCYST